MTDAELLLHYIQSTRIIHGAQRSPGHHRLVKLGFIAEHPVSIKNLLITVTAAGRTAIDCRPADYVGTHPTLWGLIPLTPQKRPCTMNASGDPAPPAMREPHCTVTRRAGLARRHGHATIIASVTIAATRARKTVASRSSFAKHICVRLHCKCYSAPQPAPGYQSRNCPSEVRRNLQLLRQPDHVHDGVLEIRDQQRQM